MAPLTAVLRSPVVAKAKPPAAASGLVKLALMREWTEKIIRRLGA